MADFGNARKWSHGILAESIRPGAIAIDATMGNGHDTLWLAQQVGENGHVYAFDIQQAAVEQTRARLEQAGLLARATLLCRGHEHLEEAGISRADAIMFNLGWLPGSPREVTTHVDTTLTAVAKACKMLNVGGVMTICVYPGHAEGMAEMKALTQWARQIDDACYDALVVSYMNVRKLPPLMIAVTRRENGQDKIGAETRQNDQTVII